MNTSTSFDGKVSSLLSATSFSIFTPLLKLEIKLSLFCIDFEILDFKEDESSPVKPFFFVDDVLSFSANFNLTDNFVSYRNFLLTLPFQFVMEWNDSSSLLSLTWEDNCLPLSPIENAAHNDTAAVNVINTIGILRSLIVNILAFLKWKSIWRYVDLQISYFSKWWSVTMIGHLLEFVVCF